MGGPRRPGTMTPKQAVQMQKNHHTYSVRWHHFSNQPGCIAAPGVFIPPSSLVPGHCTNTDGDKSEISRSCPSRDNRVTLCSCAVGPKNQAEVTKRVGMWYVCLHVAIMGVIMDGASIPSVLDILWIILLPPRVGARAV
jgi:hypothetical protein